MKVNALRHVKRLTHCLAHRECSKITKCRYRYHYSCKCQGRREMLPREPPVRPLCHPSPRPHAEPHGWPPVWRILGDALGIHAEVAPCDVNQIGPVAASCDNVTSREAGGLRIPAVATSRGSSTARLPEDSAVAPEDLGLIDGAVWLSGGCSGLTWRLGGNQVGFF